MANQMIALQAKGPQLSDPSKLTAQYANMMNMATQQRAAQLQADRTRQEMDFAKNAETRAVASEGREVDKFGAEQPQRLMSALGGGLVGILRAPTDENIMQAGKTFAAVGMEQDKFGPILQQIMDIPDPNERKLFALEFISQSEPARAALKFVMPEVKSEKVGDATVFYDSNFSSPTRGQELFRFTAPAEPIKMTQNVVDGAVINTNPVTGVSAESIVGDPRANLTAPVRNPTYSSTGVTSPYSVGGGGMGQQLMTPPPPPAAVGAPSSMGAPGRGNTADVVYGFGEFGLPPKPISQSTIGEVQDFQRNTLIPKTRGKVGAGPREGTGAVGTYQFTYGTLKEYAPKVLGPDWRNIPFTADVQEQLAKALYEDRKKGNLKDTWAGLPNNRPGQYTNVPWENVRDSIIQVESAGGGNRRTPTGGAGTGTGTGTGTDTDTGTGKPQTISDFNQQKAFKKTLQMVNYDAKTGFEIVSDLIKASTSGGAEKIGADIVGFIPESMGGGATPGAIAIGQLLSLKDSMTFEKLRGKLGAQISDADVRLVASTMGDIADANTPSPVRLAKWQNIVLPILVRGAGLTYVKPKGGGGTGGGTKVIKTLTPDQVRAAPSGTVYRTTDGRRLTKP
jgi:hypothetical protein